MLFKVIVCADDGDEVDYSIDLLRSDDAQSFIRGWQALQDAAQQGVQRTCATCGSDEFGFEEDSDVEVCAICGAIR